ncbi:hypothetical protein N7453_006657 [Penicillium expansum]|nr:hypothetical protein N7453_006657 [Penicillium expansum]
MTHTCNLWPPNRVGRINQASMANRGREDPSPLPHVIIIHSLLGRNPGLGKLAKEISRPEPQFRMGKVSSDAG